MLLAPAGRMELDLWGPCMSMTCMNENLHGQQALLCWVGVLSVFVSLCTVSSTIKKTCRLCHSYIWVGAFAEVNCPAGINKFENNFNSPENIVNAENTACK